MRKMFSNQVDEKLGIKRTVDHDRQAVLYRGGGAWQGPPGGGSFVIEWKEQKIIFSALEKVELFKEDGSSGRITYQIHTCEYPEALRPYRKEIREMIKEGLDVFGVNYGKQPGTEVRVIIPGIIGNLNPNFNWETQKIDLF